MLVEVKVLREAGWEEALYGMSMSHGKHLEDRGAMFVAEARMKRANKLAPMQGGHNKFLESMMIWLEVRAPRYWWQQADTYRIATKQSESTMHTALKRPLDQRDFAESLPVGWLEELNALIEVKNLDRLKRLLPEGFLQRRVWLMSYKTLQNVWIQRRKHKLKEWQEFLEQVLAGIQKPKYITGAVSDEQEAG